MKYKKIVILSCLILAILTIGAVSAQDNINDGDTIEVDNNLSSSNDVLKESSKTFTDLNNDINSNDDKDIYLNSDYLYDFDEDSDFEKGIVISRNMTINGNGHTIDGDNAARIFKVNKNITVEFRDIVFVNGHSSGSGGAIMGVDEYTNVAINCTFIGNSAEYGGAIFICQAIDCTFIGNTADYLGGAIYYGIVENCIFNGNSAEYGGAICYAIKVVNSRFEDNNAGTYGGALCYVSECEDSNFTHNSVDFAGGAIYGADDVTNCIFTENSAGDCGGALDTGNAIGCTFIGNTADRLGGAMYTSQDNTATDCRFIENSAQNGGAAWGLNATNCIFTGNIASDYGGAMFEGTANDCSFTDNSAGVEGDDYYTRNLGVEPYAEITNVIEYEETYEPIVRYYLPANATGSISIYIDGNDEPAYSSEVETDRWVRIYSDDLEGFEFEPGVYDIEVVYSGDEYYGGYSWEDTLWILDEDEPDENVTDDYNLTFSEYHRFNQELVKGRRTYDASFELPTRAEGNVTVYVDDEYYGVEEVEYGDAYIEVDTSDLALGKHNVRFEYSGDDYFKPSTAYDSFNVTYIDFEIPTTIKETYGMSGVTAVVALPFDATGEAKLIVDGVEKATEQIVEDDGSAFFSLLDLPYGNHTVTLTYQGNYPSASKTANVESFIVSQVAPILSVSANDINVGEKVTVNVLMNGGLNDNVLVNVNNVNYTVNIADGKGSLTVSDLARGDYDVTVTFAGDTNYLPATNSTKFTVNKISTSISAVYDAANKEITATLTNDATGKAISNTNVKFSLNGATTTVKTNSKGQAKLSTSDLPSSDYTATVSYAGNSKYKSSKTTVDITSGKADISISAVYDAANKMVTATLTNNATGKTITNVNVNVDINGVSSAAKSNSKGQVIVSDVTSGTVTISYAGNSKYNPASTTLVVSDKTDVVISADYDASNNEIIATLTNSATGKAIANTNVKVNLNGEDYTAKTDSKGQAKVSASGLPLGTYTATISYAGNSKYNPASTTIDISVKTKVIVTDVYAYEGMIVAKLTNGATGKFIANANMIVEINGVKYNAKSDNKGLLTFNTTGLDLPRAYDLTISYRGNDRYTASSATVAVDLDKANMMITTNYHADKQKMVATLKNSKTNVVVRNANMVIELNGVKTTYKSNDQGKITLLTDEFAPGTYVGTVTYPGNARYNSISAAFKVDV